MCGRDHFQCDSSFVREQTPSAKSCATMTMKPARGPAWWITGRTGTLAPWAQAVVWAALKIDKARDLEMVDEDIANLVQKVGGGTPSKTAIAKWRRLMDTDKDWYPGKDDGEKSKPGPRRLLNVQKQTAIAHSAMACKRAGLEPSVALVRERCPDATWNPKTKAPFTDKYILDVFKKRCHDDDSDVLWTQQYPLQKTALPDFLMEWRETWGRRELLVEGHNAGWFFRHCVWVDPCYNILSTNRRQVFALDKAKSAKTKRWMSKDKRTYSRNLRGSQHGGKQQQFGDRKVWWFVMVTRGRIHIEVMGGAWRQIGKGMAEFVDRLPAALVKMVGAEEALPRIVFSDRGPGFYQGSTGHIVREYADALEAQGFRPYAGADASTQPPDIPDVLPHETAVAWIRNFLRKRKFSRSGSLDTQEEKLRELLLACERHVNSNHDVDGLCRSFPERLKKLVAKKGDRLSH